VALFSQCILEYLEAYNFVHTWAPETLFTSFGKEFAIMEKKILRVTIHSRNVEAFTKLLREHRYLDMAGEHRDKDGNVRAEAFVPESQIVQLQKQPGVEIKVVEDAHQTGLKRQNEVSSMNQFARADDERKPPGPPRGFGKKE
jgi:hypothetical protein